MFKKICKISLNARIHDDVCLNLPLAKRGKRLKYRCLFVKNQLSHERSHLPWRYHHISSGIEPARRLGARAAGPITNQFRGECGRRAVSWASATKRRTKKDRTFCVLLRQRDWLFCRRPFSSQGFKQRNNLWDTSDQTPRRPCKSHVVMSTICWWKTKRCLGCLGDGVSACARLLLDHARTC